jgi:CheY-like chemotaxis protein
MDAASILTEFREYSYILKRMDRILIVDDEFSILELLKDFLSGEGFEIQTACDGLEALDLLEKDNRFNMILSDINMPRLKGFELLSRVEKLYPHIRRVLITAYNVEDYITLALKYGISNIITKTTPFNFDEILLLVRNLIQGTIFGISGYLKPGTPIRNIPVISPQKVHDYALEPIREFRISRGSRNLEMVVVELLNNAVYYGARDMDPEKKEDWDERFILNEGEVDIYYGSDDEKCVIAVTDNGGKLSKEKVMYWLGRQMERDNSGLPVGLYDVHGRGLYISREYMDRLIINIEKKKRTEIICILYQKDAYKGHKPLLINEI